MGLFGKKQPPLLTVTEREGGRALLTVDHTGQVALHVNSLDEAQVAIQLLKLKKKELALSKRQVTTQQQQLRTQHTDWVRRHGPGSGVFSEQSKWGRGKERKQLAEHLAPLEQTRAALNVNVLAVENAMLRLEEYILTHTPPEIPLQSGSKRQRR